MRLWMSFLRGMCTLSGSLAGCDCGLWMGETWEVASSVSAGFLIQTQNRTEALGIAGRQLPSLSAEGQF